MRSASVEPFCGVAIIPLFFLFSSVIFVQRKWEYKQLEQQQQLVDSEWMTAMNKIKINQFFSHYVEQKTRKRRRRIVEKSVFWSLNHFISEWEEWREDRKLFLVLSFTNFFLYWFSAFWLILINKIEKKIYIFDMNNSLNGVSSFFLALESMKIN